MLLASVAEIEDKSSTKSRMVSPYTGKTKMLLSYIDMLEKTNRFDEVILYHPEVKKLVKDFESLFSVVKAAGGLVKDESNKVLMIYRRGHWDLPKGKLDKGEKKKAAAVREVEEETGISSITLKKRIMTTRHTFRNKSGKRVLKKTYWYKMKAPNQALVPQSAEDIEKAEWHDLSKGLNYKEPVYGNIVDVLERAGFTKKY